MATTVAVLGLGALGSATAFSLASTGPQLIVWNRTHEKSLPFRKLGVRVARTLHEAINASDIVFIATSKITDVTSQIQTIGVDIRRKQFINLTTSIPSDLQTLAHHVDAAGGRFLDGIVQCLAHEIGSESAMIACCGDRAAWESSGRILRRLAPITTYASCGFVRGDSQ